MMWREGVIYDRVVYEREEEEEERVRGRKG